MPGQIQAGEILIGDIPMEVILKKIRHVHLWVYAPDGRVVITAPMRTKMEFLHAFAASRLDWIRNQQAKIRARVPEAHSQFVDGEIHTVWGAPHELKVVEWNKAPDVFVDDCRLVISVRPGTTGDARHSILDAWYREQVRNALPSLIEKWEPVMAVKVEKFHVQRMKTRWGTCVPRRHSIRINTELARHPREWLEYVVIHEMAHLLEPSHGPRFFALMDRFSPGWMNIRKALNARPLPGED